MALFVVSVIAVSAENLDVSSREFPLFCSVFFCLHCSMLSYPCVKMVEFHHPSFFFSLVFKSIRLVTFVYLLRIKQESHNFLISHQSKTIINVGSHISLKLNLSIDLYCQSSCGKPLYDSVSLKEISWAVIINGRLTRGVERCLIYGGAKMKQELVNLKI